MRNPQVLLALAMTLCLAPEARAAETLKPADIKAIFATGKQFAAKAPSGKELMLTLKPDGTAAAVSKGKKKGAKGSWRVSDNGYCSTWGKGPEHCYTIVKSGDGYDVLTMSGIIAAHWTKP